MWLAYKLGVECKHFTDIQFDSGKCTDSLLMLEPEAVHLNFNFSSDNPVVKHYKWIRIQSTIYRKAMFFLLEFPVFGEITDIAHVENTVILYVNVHKTKFLIQNLIPMLFYLLLLSNMLVLKVFLYIIAYFHINHLIRVTLMCTCHFLITCV